MSSEFLMLPRSRRRHIWLAGVTAATLTLSACDNVFEGDEVTVTVTGTANVRDAATTEGSNVIAKLEAGTELSGEWIETGSGPRDRWLEFDFNGKKGFVWAGNLDSKDDASDSDRGAASLPPSNAPAEMDFTRRPNPDWSRLNPKAERWAGCSTTWMALLAYSIGGESSEETQKNLSAKLWYAMNIAVQLRMLQGFSVTEAKQWFKDVETPQKRIFVPNQIPQSEKYQYFMKQGDVCNQLEIDAKRDPDTAYVIANFQEVFPPALPDTFSD